MLWAGTVVRMPSQELKGSLERVPQKCIESKKGMMMDGKKHGSLPSTGYPHAFLALVPADARQHPVLRHWFPNTSSHSLRTGVSVEMLSETDSRDLLDLMNF